MYRKCNVCKHEKELEKDFYFSKGNYRGECKKCTSRKNSERAQRTGYSRFKSAEARREHQREYYRQNKERFKVYRKRFLEKNPEYFKNYKRGIKGKKFLREDKTTY